MPLNQSPGRGGKRAGAGRPPGDPDLIKIPVGYKLPRWLVEWLRTQDVPAAQLIEGALCERHNLQPLKIRRKAIIAIKSGKRE